MIRAVVVQFNHKTGNKEYNLGIIENGRITGLMGADILLTPHQTGGLRYVHTAQLYRKAVTSRTETGTIQADRYRVRQ